MVDSLVDPEPQPISDTESKTKVKKPRGDLITATPIKKREEGKGDKVVRPMAFAVEDGVLSTTLAYKPATPDGYEESRQFLKFLV